MLKVAVIGAGSVVFTQHIVNDILFYESLKDQVEICLMDIDEDRLETAYQLIVQLIDRHQAKAKVYKTLNRREAVKDAKYVINTIQVGGLEATKIDFDIPEKYGLKQTIGDTHGIGAIFRAVRTIPEVLKIARDMEELSPKDAILINYSNPMAMVTWSVFAATSVNVVGLCHSIQGTARQLASYMNLDYSNLRYRAGGINHLDWFIELEVDGKDVYPMLFKAMEDPEVYKKDKVRFEFMKLFGHFVSESSEHLSEYLPYFIKEEDKITDLNIPIREYIRRCEVYVDIYEDRKAMARGEKPVPEMKPSSEYAAKIIWAKETGQHITIHGNVKNSGLIPNLPDDCCVEVPVLVNKNGLQPTYFGSIPPQLAAINKWHINIQELTIKAVLEKRKDYLYHAALLDPLANAMLTVDQIKAMTDEMIEAYSYITSEFSDYKK